MNRIQNLFTHKNTAILSVYFTAGYPQLQDTASIIKELAKAGVDMIEIGMPFSDPLADGPVIQQSSSIALQNGMSVKLLFEQLQSIRADVSIPLILMGYINPVLQFGVEEFCKTCKSVGIDGLILPDLPLQEYKEHYEHIFKSYGLENILLISPQTTDDRIHVIDNETNGFIYMVSTSSTTGAKSKFTDEQVAYFTRVASMNLKNPLLVGFGISNTETFSQVCEHTSGAIVGSSFIKALDGTESIQEKVRKFVKQIKG